MMDMREIRRHAVAPYLERLLELPFVRDAHIIEETLPLEGDGAAIRVRLLTADGPQDFRAAVQPSRRLGESLLGRALGQLSEPPVEPWLYFTPYVNDAMASRVRSSGGNFVDLLGNCHLSIAHRILVSVEGRRPRARAAETKGLGAAGFKVMMWLMTNDESRAASVRDLATHAGVGKSAAAMALTRLESSGLIIRTKKRIGIPDRDRFLERWLAGYLELIRPRLLIGRFATHDADPTAFEAKWEATVAKQSGRMPEGQPRTTFGAHDRIRWAWGGSAAAWRLDHFFRGNTTTLHVQGWSPAQERLLGLLPSREGSIVVLSMDEGVPISKSHADCVHPLLVYAELIDAGLDREREAAELLRKRHLGFAA